MVKKEIIFLVGLIMFIGIVVAGTFTVENMLGGTQLPAVNEDVESVFNLSVNWTITAGDGEFNITEVNITIPSSFVFNAGSNGTNLTGFTTFRNRSNSTVGHNLTWTNSTATSLLTNTSSAYFWFNATPSTPDNYTILVTAINGTAESFETLTYVVYVVVNDTSSATINLTYPVDLANFSLNNTIVFNVTAWDNINVTNASLYGNWTNGATTGWQINQTVFPSGNNIGSSLTVPNMTDGVYRWNYYVCDNSSNCAFATNNYTLVVDTTAPTVSFSCIPLDVNDGSVITCSCTGADNIDGNPNEAYTVNPLTSSTGVFTTTCTVTDFVGNSVSSSVTYSVESGSSWRSFSSSSTTTDEEDELVEEDFWEGGEIEVVTVEEFLEGVQKKLDVKDRVEVVVDSGGSGGNSTHHIGVTEIKVTTAKIQVSSTPQVATLSVGDERKFEVTDDNYYDIYVKLNSISNGKADITVKSIYEEVTTETEAEEAGKDEAAKDEAKEESNWWVWVIVIVVILVLVGGGYEMKRRRNYGSVKQ